MPDTRWETLEVQESFDLLLSSEAGLTSDEALKRLAEVGPNVLAAEEKINIFSIMLHQFNPAPFTATCITRVNCRF